MSVLDLFDLHGKRALITGASTGIGKRVALAYVEAGAQVAIAARHLDALEKLADEIGTSGGKVVPVCCDVSQHQQVTSMLDQVTAGWVGSTSRSATPASSRSLRCWTCRWKSSSASKTPM